MEGICRLEWCEDESDALHQFEPTSLCTEGESDSSHGTGSFVLSLLNSLCWEVLYFQPEGIGFKMWVRQATEVLVISAESETLLLPSYKPALLFFSFLFAPSLLIFDLLPSFPTPSLFAGSGFIQIILSGFNSLFWFDLGYSCRYL